METENKNKNKKNMGRAFVSMCLEPVVRHSVESTLLLLGMRRLCGDALTEAESKACDEVLSDCRRLGQRIAELASLAKLNDSLEINRTNANTNTN